MCSRPFRPLGFAHLCRSRPRGSVQSLLRLQLYVDHSHCPRACASYPSCVAVYPRDSHSRRVLCRFSQKLHSTSRFAHLCRTPPSGSIRSLLPSQLYLDHSHCPVLAPGRADLHSLAALPSTRSIETRSLPSFDSCAPAHFDLSVLPMYAARIPAAPFSPLPSAALPSMSLSPKAPFPRSGGVLCC